MRTIACNNIDKVGFEANRRTIAFNNINIFRVGEVIPLNLVSSIKFISYEEKSKIIKSKKRNATKACGYEVYEALEFGKRNSSNMDFNPQFELICSAISLR